MHPLASDPEIPPQTKANQVLCTCGIACQPARYVCKGTYYRHRELIQERQSAIAEGRPVRAYARGLKRDITLRRQEAKRRAEAIACVSGERGPSIVKKEEEDAIGRDFEKENASTVSYLLLRRVLRAFNAKMGSRLE